MRVHPSALKHGVSAEDAIQAAEWSLWIEPLDEGGPPDRELPLGFDTSARLLETVVVVSQGGDEMAIHAMPARKTYPGPPVIQSVPRGRAEWALMEAA